MLYLGGGGAVRGLLLGRCFLSVRCFCLSSPSFLTLASDLGGDGGGWAALYLGGFPFSLSRTVGEGGTGHFTLPVSCGVGGPGTLPFSSSSLVFVPPPSLSLSFFVGGKGGVRRWFGSLPLLSRSFVGGRGTGLSPLSASWGGGGPGTSPLTSSLSLASSAFLGRGGRYGVAFSLSLSLGGEGSSPIQVSDDGAWTGGWGRKGYRGRYRRASRCSDIARGGRGCGGEGSWRSGSSSLADEVFTRRIGGCGVSIFNVRSSTEN